MAVKWEATNYARRVVSRSLPSTSECLPVQLACRFWVVRQRAIAKGCVKPMKDVCHHTWGQTLGQSSGTVGLRQTLCSKVGCYIR